MRLRFWRSEGTTPTVEGGRPRRRWAFWRRRDAAPPVEAIERQSFANDSTLPSEPMPERARFDTKPAIRDPEPAEALVEAAAKTGKEMLADGADIGRQLLSETKTVGGKKSTQEDPLEGMIDGVIKFFGVKRTWYTEIAAALGISVVAVAELGGIFWLGHALWVAPLATLTGVGWVVGGAVVAYGIFLGLKAMWQASNPER